MTQKIAGFCPMGCGETLYLNIRGHVTCDGLTCPRPTAASEILGEQETGHIAKMTRRDFSLIQWTHLEESKG